MGFLIGRSWALFECHKVTFQNFLRHVCDTSSLPKGLSGHRLKTTTWKEDHFLLRINRGNRSRSLLAPMIRVELIRRIKRRVFICVVQRRLIVAGYHWRHPDRCPRLTPDYRYLQRMLVHHYQNWNHQYWSHVIYVDEAMVSLYHSDHPVSWVDQFTSLSTTQRSIRARSLEF